MIFYEGTWNVIGRFLDAYRLHEAAIKAHRAALNIRHNNKARRRLFRLAQDIARRTRQ